MDSPGFEDLLKRMPEIARAVNAFQSQDVQREALDALIKTFFEGRSQQSKPVGTGSTTPAAPSTGGGRKRRTSRKKSAATKSATASGSKPKKATGPTLVKELNLGAVGKKPSFADFVVEKQPKTNQERNVATVYWLKEVAGKETVTRDEVYTAFRSISGWKVPADPTNSLQLTASRKNWLDTANMNDLKLTPQGLNEVEHDLPTTKK